jgi:hypothetical protein
MQENKATGCCGSMEASKEAEAAQKMGSLSSCGGVSAGGTEQVKEHMDVIASCGKKIGVVDRVEGKSIKLTKKESPDGQHHRIPTSWLDHVDSHVHLNKNSEEATREWQPV